MTVKKIPIEELGFDLPKPTLEDIAVMASHAYAKDKYNSTHGYRIAKNSYHQGFLAGLNYKFTGEWDTKEGGE